MADKDVQYEASNIFGLNSNFKGSGSTTDGTSTNPQVQDELGNVSCERVIQDRTDYTWSGQYCGSDFVGDLGTFLTEFGNVQNGKLVDSVSITFTSADYVSIDVNGHNHDVNAHEAGLAVGYCDVSDFLPHEIGESFASFTGFGVPDFGVTLGDNATPSGATVTFSFGTHDDKVDESGDHFVGKNITPRAELTIDFVGIPTSNTTTLLDADWVANTNDMLGCVTDTVSQSDSNTDVDTFALTAHAHPALATA